MIHCGNNNRKKKQNDLNYIGTFILLTKILYFYKSCDKICLNHDETLMFKDKSIDSFQSLKKYFCPHKKKTKKNYPLKISLNWYQEKLELFFQAV